jgi:hypothetical protein
MQIEKDKQQILKNNAKRIFDMKEIAHRNNRCNPTKLCAKDSSVVTIEFTHYPLLGSEGKTDNETTSAARQHILNKQQLNSSN